MCWDDMEEPGYRVTALETPHFVCNYPLKRQDATQQRRVKVVEFLRNVEHKERRLRTPQEHSIMTQIELDKAHPTRKNETEEEAAAGGVTESTAADLDGGISAAMDMPDDEEEPPLESKDGDTIVHADASVHPYYHYNELYTPNRRTAQRVLLGAELRASMAAFNVQVKALLDKKVSDPEGLRGAHRDVVMHACVVRVNKKAVRSWREACSKANCSGGRASYCLTHLACRP
jgi:hypothetical protein